MAGSPTLRRRKLAAEMRRLREEAGMTIDVAAERAEIAKSTLSRVENALVTPRLPALRALLRVYGVGEAEVEFFVQLAKSANQRGWWQQYSEAVPDWFEMYVGLEGAASEIRTYESMFVPGLLQTEDYAFTVLRDGERTKTDDEIRRLVSVRMSRQSIVTDTAGPILWFVIDQAVLARQVGGRKVMQGQLDRLREVSENPRVTLAVLPFSVGSYPMMGSAFTLLTFAEEPEIVYLENRTSALYLERPDQVREYRLTYDYMTAAADSGDRARALIEQTRAER